MNRHITSKHQQQGKVEKSVILDFEINNAILKNLVIESKSKIMKNECLPESMRKHLSSYEGGFEESLLLENIQDINNIKNLTKSKDDDREQFFAKYYERVVLNCESYFPDLPLFTGRLVTKHLGDLLLKLTVKNNLGCVSPPPPITNKEL